jgi:hypothetical protein
MALLSEVVALVALEKVLEALQLVPPLEVVA